MLNSAIRNGYLNNTAGTMLCRFVTAFIVDRAIVSSAKKYSANSTIGRKRDLVIEF